MRSITMAKNNEAMHCEGKWQRKEFNHMDEIEKKLIHQIESDLQEVKLNSQIMERRLRIAMLRGIEAASDFLKKLQSNLQSIIIEMEEVGKSFEDLNGK